MGAGPSKVAEKKVKEVVEDLGWDDAPSGAVQEDSDEEDDKTTAPVLSEKDMKDAQVSYGDLLLEYGLCRPTD